MGWKLMFYSSLFFIAFLLLTNFSACTSNQSVTVVSQQSGAPVRKPYVDKGMIVLDDRPKDSVLVKLKDSVAEIEISIVGDLMCHMPQTNNAKTDSAYDFTPSFEFVKPYLENSDLTIGNLELTCAGADRSYSGYPNFNAPDEYIEALKKTGFDFLVTANNHSMDMGEKGLLRTIEQIKRNKLGYAGTFESQKDHDSLRLLSVKGIRIAVLNYTYGTNGSYPDVSRKYMLNVIDSAAIVAEVRKSKSAGADFVLVYFHFGVEYAAEPIESQKNALRWARAAGADIVLGAHPHVVGPCRWLIPDATHPDTCFVAWSLGNFLSNQNKRYTDAGVILTLHVKKNFDQKSTCFGQAEYLPTWVYRGEKSSKKMHVIFPSELSQQKRCPDYIDENLLEKMKQAFEDTREVVNRFGQTVILKTIH
jgi:poly-gamma-glutamate capsule biosynthesis protein CapA/YwtB (metallophosphatase superfamily)